MFEELAREWPSDEVGGQTAQPVPLTEVRHGCIWSETGWATSQMKDQNSSLRRPSEGTLN